MVGKNILHPERLLHIIFYCDNHINDNNVLGVERERKSLKVAQAVRTKIVEIDF